MLHSVLEKTMTRIASSRITVIRLQKNADVVHYNDILKYVIQITVTLFSFSYGSESTLTFL